jgi:hypothetical protein
MRRGSLVNSVPAALPGIRDLVENPCDPTQLFHCPLFKLAQRTRCDCWRRCPRFAASPWPRYRPHFDERARACCRFGSRPIGRAGLGCMGKRGSIHQRQQPTLGAPLRLPHAPVAGATYAARPDLGVSFRPRIKQTNAPGRSRLPADCKGAWLLRGNGTLENSLMASTAQVPRKVRNCCRFHQEHFPALEKIGHAPTSLSNSDRL